MSLINMLVVPITLAIAKISFKSNKKHEVIKVFKFYVRLMKNTLQLNNT